MNKDTFQALIEQSIKKKKKLIQESAEPFEYYTLHPSQAAEIEKRLNQHKRKPTTQGYFLQQVRRPEQILYKPVQKLFKKQGQNGKKTFAKYQAANLFNFQERVNFIKDNLTEKQMHWLAVLEKLRKHPLSKCFMRKPHLIRQKCYDINEKIPQQLTLKTIAFNVFTGKYTSSIAFQTAMVKMIQHFRIYFASRAALFDASIKFENLFWKYYRRINWRRFRKAYRKFQYFKSRCTVKKIRIQRKPKLKVSLQKKKKLLKLFNSQTTELKMRIMSELKKGVMKGKLENIGNTFDVRNFKAQFFVQLQQHLKANKVMMQENHQDQRSKQKQRQRSRSRQRRSSRLKQRQKQRQRQKKKEKKTTVKKVQKEQIFYSDEQTPPSKLPNGNRNNQELKQVMDAMNQQAFIFDSDDYD